MSGHDTRLAPAASLNREPNLRGRLLIGAIAGVAGTLAIAAAMNELQRRLPRSKTSESSNESPPDEAAIDAATAGQFAYGAACGSLLGAATVRIGPVTGALAGIGIWVANRLGGMPGSALLSAADAASKRRNALTLAAHLIWGVATARAMRELLKARENAPAVGDKQDEA